MCPFFSSGAQQHKNPLPFSFDRWADRELEPIAYLSATPRAVVLPG
jgi:hypothetical protein